MTQSTAHFATRHASKYLQQLCKHFAHKTEVTFAPTQGRVALPFGTCDRRAADEMRTLEAHAEAASRTKLERILADNLARFAFRDTPDLMWRKHEPS